MTAARLREAAKVLLERAEAVEEPEGNSLVDSWSQACADHIPGADGVFVATMTPDVGLALADALEQLADERDLFGHPGPKTIDNNALVRVADLILGGEQS